MVLLAVAPVFGQTDRLETFRANFGSANMETKLEILRSADSEDATRYGPLYGQALHYVISNADDLGRSTTLREITLKTITRIDEGRYRPALSNLWRLFQIYADTTTRIQVLGVIGRIAEGDAAEVDYLIDWVSRQNALNQSPGQVDYQVLAAAVRALGELGTEEAFHPIVNIILAQFPQYVTTEARLALEKIEGNRLELASDVLNRKSVSEKDAAFSFFLDGDFLAEEEKGPLAHRALNIAMSTHPQGVQEQSAVRQFRYHAAAEVRERSYSDATSAIIRHFNITVAEFDRGEAAMARLLEAIAALGAMGNEQAAQRLTDYLDSLNTYTEQDRPYDTQVVLATIQNLRSLSYPGSYNALFLTTTLENYPDRVRDAAREASTTVSE